MLGTHSTRGLEDYNFTYRKSVMRLTPRFLGLIIAVIITGCISTRPRPEPLPYWVENVPTDSIYFYGVGIGETSSLVLARKVAIMRARADLGMNIEVHIRELHRLIVTIIDTAFDSQHFPENPRYPNLLDFPTQEIKGSTVDQTEGNGLRTYALVKVSINSVDEAILDWVRPKVPTEYYDLLAALLNERQHK